MSLHDLNECCANCKHYTETYRRAYRESYCSIIDDLVNPLDNCGMFNCGDAE